MGHGVRSGTSILDAMNVDDVNRIEVAGAGNAVIVKKAPPGTGIEPEAF